MTFVPIVTPPPNVPVSPRTRELASLLGQVLEEYQKAHPATTRNEVRAAMRMAQVSGGPGASPLVLKLTLALGLLVAGVLAGVFVFLRQGGDMSWGESVPMVAVALGVFLLMLVVLVVKGSR